MPKPITPANRPRPGLWARLGQAWAALLGRTEQATPGPVHTSTHTPTPTPTNRVPSAHNELVTTVISPLEPTQSHRLPQPYNPQALPTARKLWQQGDWASLASMSLDKLQDHPDRAKLALLAAAGHMQMGRTDTGADCLRQAKAWGCSPRLMRQVVVAGVHNTLGKAAALANRPELANQHFAASLQIVMPMASGQAQVQQRQATQTQAFELLH